MVFGWGCAVVQSGSMEPAIPIGSMVVLHEQETYIPGDVIVYESNSGATITHRLQSVTTDGLFITQGDANNAADDPVLPEKVIGSVRYVIPSIGTVLAALKYTVIPIVLPIFIAITIYYWLRREKTE